MHAFATPGGEARPPDGLVLRAARPEDAAVLLAFGETLLGETDFLARGPGERARSVDEMRRVIETFARLPGHLLLNAWADDAPVGEVVVMGGQMTRNRHAATLGLGVLRSHWRRGVGTRLLAAAEDFARAEGIHRLELSVMTQNRAAQALYRRAGFAVEGTKRHSLRIGGEDRDEFLMAKLLPPAGLPDGSDGPRSMP